MCTSTYTLPGTFNDCLRALLNSLVDGRSSECVGVSSCSFTLEYRCPLLLERVQSLYAVIRLEQGFVRSTLKV